MSGLQSPFWQDLQTVLAAVHPRTRRMVWVTAALGLFAGLLEAVGVGAVVPLVVVMTEPDIAARFPAAAAYLPAGLLADRPMLIVTVAALFALLFLAKSAMSLLVTWLQSSVRGRLSAELSSRLFADYLHRPYSFHLQRNAADISTRLMYGVESAGSAMSGVSQLVVEGIALLAIGALLIYVNPAAALVTIAVIGLPAFVTYRAMRRRVRKVGADMHQLYEQATNSTLHALGGIKELKVLGREAAFHKTYSDARAELGRVEAQHGVLNASPRLVLELATVFAVLALASVLAVQGQVLVIAPLLGLYAAAAFRVLPAANRVLSSMQMLRYSEAGLHKVAQDLSASLPEDAADGPAKPLHFTGELRLQNLSYRHGPDLPLVLNEVNLTIRAGECIGFAGPTGAGKSTLMDLVLGVLPPVVGQITADGVDIQQHLRAWQAGIGYVPQSIFLLDDTIRANVAFGVPDDQVDESRIWQVLRAAQLADFVSAQPQGIQTRVGERGVRISGGECQRIGIARALYHNPGLLILDEATSALDSATEAELMNSVFALRGQKTMLIVAHRLTTIERCDRICLIEDGRLSSAPGRPKGV